MLREVFPSFVTIAANVDALLFFSLLFPVFLLLRLLLSSCAIVLIYDCIPRDEKIARNITQGFSLGEAKTKASLNWKSSSKSTRFPRRNYFNKNVDYVGRHMKDLTWAKPTKSIFRERAMKRNNERFYDWNALWYCNGMNEAGNDSGTSRRERPNPAQSRRAKAKKEKTPLLSDADLTLGDTSEDTSDNRIRGHEGCEGFRKVRPPSYKKKESINESEAKRVTAVNGDGV